MVLRHERRRRGGGHDCVHAARDEVSVQVQRCCASVGHCRGRSLRGAHGLGIWRVVHELLEQGLVALLVLRRGGARFKDLLDAVVHHIRHWRDRCGHRESAAGTAVSTATAVITSTTTAAAVAVAVAANDSDRSESSSSREFLPPSDAVPGLLHAQEGSEHGHRRDGRCCGRHSQGGWQRDGSRRRLERRRCARRTAHVGGRWINGIARRHHQHRSECWRVRRAPR